MLQGLWRSLVSAQLVSQATVKFFDDLHQRASEVMKLLEKSNINTVDQLQKFEKEFKVKKQKVAQLCSINILSVCKRLNILFFSLFQEESLREENSALEKIAAILATLTTKKAAMVSL